MRQLRDNRKVFTGLEKSFNFAKLESQLPAVEPATTLLTLAPAQFSTNAIANNSLANNSQPNYAPNTSGVQSGEASQQPNLPGNSQVELQQQVVPQSPKAQMDFQARQRSIAQNAGQNFSLNNDFNNVPGNNVSEVQMSVMTPLWLGDDLVLARRVQAGDKQYLQGCLLNWPTVKQELLDSIRDDLLPNAQLLRVADATPASDLRRLASLPVQLIPGEIPEAASPGSSPIKQSLLLAWLAMGLAAIAVAALLQGVISLSERRAAFVSAVTHELRTPLTTFRMYAEMLSEGMLVKESDRRHYLDTLRIEADRLTHLVANVLAYARLERGRPGGRIESISIQRLLEVATQALGRPSQSSEFATFD